MYKYFILPGTREELKEQYRALCFKHHPDMGGDTRTMQEINAEWAKIQSQAAYSEASDRQKTAHADGKKSAGDYHDLNEVTEILRQKIEIALNLAGVDVELMGLWVWCTGNTKEHRETFKANGFKWAQNKTAWYYAGVPTFNRRKNTLDEIRNAYGSQTFSKAKREEHAELNP